MILLEQSKVRLNVRSNEYVSDALIRNAVNENFFYEFVFFYFFFEFLGEDVFSALCYDDGFLAARHVEESVLIHTAEVSGVEPAVSDHLVGRGLVLIITEHDRRALNDDFSDSVCVRIFNLYSRSAHGATDRACDAVIVLVDRDNRRALRHAVTLHHRNSHGLKVFYYLGVNRCATRNELLHVSAERIVDGFEHPLHDARIVVELKAF